MTIDVASCIAPLLYEYDDIQIPGLGTLSANYASSRIDHVQGIIRPPSKKLQFDPLQEEEADDRLSQRVAEKFDLSLDQAQEEVVNYVLDLIQRISEKEMVNIPKVGRLYKNYKGEFQFLQDNINFNTQSFGLPALNYYPISREVPVEDKVAPKPTQLGQVPGDDQKVPGSESGKGGRRKLLPLAVMLLVVLAAFFVWDYSNDQNKLPLPVSENRVNTKPQLDGSFPTDADENIADPSEENKPAKTILEEMEESSDLDDAEKDTGSNPQKEVEAGSIPSEDIPVKECIVIVGLFKEDLNVQRLSDKISAIDNYYVYTAPHQKMTRVGITFDCSRMDLQTELDRIKNEFTKDAWVLKQ